MVVYGIQEVDTLESVAKVKVGLKVEWIDYRLVWDPEDYGNINDTDLFFSKSQSDDYIWTPDLTMYENAMKAVDEDLEFVTA